MTPLNQSEEYVFNITRRASLSLWSYANPIKGENGKELCDVLIVFGNRIAILSVKDIQLANDNETGLSRWRRRAIVESSKQLYGAERWLRSATHIIRYDGSKGLPLPTPSEMCIHKIAVALGSKGKAPYPLGDFGKGYVHVFDDKAFDIILNELDTPSDLFEYLDKKISFLSTASHVLLEGGEEDLLAYYLANGRSFPSITGVIVGSGIWDDFSSKSEYRARQIANKHSMIWDGLIETVARHALAGTLEFGPTLSETELSLRFMASENRYQRRCLGLAFKEFLDKSVRTIKSRMVVSTSGITYVFLATPLNTNRDDRLLELRARCFVARGKIRENPTVVGIATEQYVKGQGFSLDVGCIIKLEWTSDDENALTELLSITPYFQGEFRRAFGEMEYPQDLAFHN